MRSIRLWSSLLLKVVRAEWFELHHSNASHVIIFTLSTESISMKKKMLLYMCVKPSTLRKAKDNIHLFYVSYYFLTIGNTCIAFCMFICFVFMHVADRRNGKCRVFIMWSFTGGFFHPSESKDQNEIVFSNLNVLFFLNGRTPEVLRCNLAQNMHCYSARNTFLMDLFFSYGR